MEDLAFGVACVEASGPLQGPIDGHHHDLGIGNGRLGGGFKYPPGD